MDEVQAIVDRLAVQICRGVAVDDARFSLVAFSSHGLEVDEVRQISILSRRAPSNVTGWLRSLGVQNAPGAIHVQANDDLHMQARLCVPVRWDGLLFGYLFVIEGEVPLSDEHVAFCVGAAAAIGEAMYSTRLESDHRRDQELHWLLDLISDDPDRRARCAAAVHEAGDHASGCSAIVVKPFSPEHGALHTLLLSGIWALEHVRRTIPGRRLLFGQVDDYLLALLMHRPGDPGPEGAEALAASLLQELRSRHSEVEWHVVRGQEVSSPIDFVRSHGTALSTLELTVLCGQHTADDVVGWEQLGGWQVVLRCLGNPSLDLVLHPGIARLRTERDGEMLLETLSCYLDAAGDARAAAAQLFIHRATLYARLRRIEQIGGIDLADGDQRLHVHMSLRLASAAQLWDKHARGSRPEPAPEGQSHSSLGHAA